MTALEILERSFRPVPPDEASGFAAGVYLLIHGAEVVYVGSSYVLFSRIKQHVSAAKSVSGHVEPKVFDRAVWIERENRWDRWRLESALIRAFAPRYNYATTSGPWMDAAILGELGIDGHPEVIAGRERWRRELPTKVSWGARKRAAAQRRAA